MFQGGAGLLIVKQRDMKVCDGLLFWVRIMLDITPTTLDGVLVIMPKRHNDDHGFFSETFSQKLLAQTGIQIEFVQDNQSLSMSKGAVRGLRFQTPPHA
ncbi:MAG: dTDP-4-dehydrorhamnose 3,5-epimerase [Candidatus Azotimanducaceae bacterium]